MPRAILERGSGRADQRAFTREAMRDTSSPTFAIDPVLTADAGVYDVVIFNGCVSVTSGGATLSVSTCPADFNGDGTPNSTDFFEYLNAFFAGENMLEAMATLVPGLGWLLPVPFYFLELLVGLVQALVFTLLTAVFTLLICQHEEASPQAAHDAES